MLELGYLYFQVFLGNQRLLLLVALGASCTAERLARCASSRALDVWRARELRRQRRRRMVEVDAELDLGAVLAGLERVEAVGVELRVVLQRVQVQRRVDDELRAARPHKTDFLVAGRGPHRLQGAAPDLGAALDWHASERLHVNLKLSSLSALCAGVVRLVLEVGDFLLALVLLDNFGFGSLGAQLLLDLQLHVAQVADVVGERLVRRQLALALQLTGVGVGGLADSDESLGISGLLVRAADWARLTGVVEDVVHALVDVARVVGAVVGSHVAVGVVLGFPGCTATPADRRSVKLLRSHFPVNVLSYVGLRVVMLLLNLLKELLLLQEILLLLVELNLKLFAPRIRLAKWPGIGLILTT